MAACLLAPAAAAVVRKFTPGQPEYLQIGGTSFVIVGGLWAWSHRRKLPGYVATPLLVWAAFQGFFVIPALIQDSRIGVTAVVTRIAPMLMASVAYAAIRDSRDLSRVAAWVCALAPLMLPAVLIAVLFGNEALPAWLQPIQKYTERGLHVWKSQFQVGTGIFSTPTGLAYAMLSIGFLAIATVAGVKGRKGVTLLWWGLLAIAAVILYTTARRTPIIWLGIGLIAFLLSRPKALLGLSIAIGAVVTAVVWLDASPVSGRAIETRSDLFQNMDFYSRFDVIFLYETLHFINIAPFGNFLGYGGPEASAFGMPITVGVWDWNQCEVGSALLVADMGFLGLVLMPAIVIFIVYQLNRRSKGLACRAQVVILLAFFATVFAHFFFKAAPVLNRGSIANILFWAVPGICAALIENDKRQVIVSDTRHDTGSIAWVAQEAPGEGSAQDASVNRSLGSE